MSDGWAPDKRGRWHRLSDPAWTRRPPAPLKPHTVCHLELDPPPDDVRPEPPADAERCATCEAPPDDKPLVSDPE